MTLGDAVAARYGELHGRAGAIAGALRAAHGLAPGERVAIFMANRPDYLEALFGIWYAGLVAVPVNAKLHPREVAYIPGQFGESALHHRRRPRRRGFESVRDEVPGLAAPLVAGSDEWAHHARARRGRPRRSPARRPGLALLHQRYHRPAQGRHHQPPHLLVMTLSYFADLNRIAPDDCVLHAAPLSHGSGLYALPFIAKGANNVIPESGGFEPAEVLA